MFIFIPRLKKVSLLAPKFVVSCVFLWFTLTNGADGVNPKEKKCKGQTKFLRRSTFPGESYPGQPVITKVLSTMKKHVFFLDITLLTKLRKYGHPSIYGSSGQLDCSH